MQRSKINILCNSSCLTELEAGANTDTKKKLKGEENIRTVTLQML